MRVREFAVDAMRPYFASLDGPVREIVSVAGTATSLVSIELGMETYDAQRVHGSRLDAGSIRTVRERLASLRLSDRQEVVGLHPGRASVIVAGALILEAVLECTGLDSTLVSEHDILYGILLDLYRNGAPGTAPVG